MLSQNTPNHSDQSGQSNKSKLPQQYCAVSITTRAWPTIWNLQLPSLLLIARTVSSWCSVHCHHICTDARDSILSVVWPPLLGFPYACKPLPNSWAPWSAKQVTVGTDTRGCLPVLRSSSALHGTHWLSVVITHHQIDNLPKMKASL